MSGVALESLARPGGVLTVDEAATVAVGKGLAVDLGKLRSKDADAPGGMWPVLLLEGEMGVGKTVLVRGLAEGLGLDPRQVQSPTFTLVNQYADAQNLVRLVHCDLYRLEPEEVESTGLLDLLVGGDSLVVVEWSERLPMAVPSAVRLRLSRLAEMQTEGGRRIESVASQG